MLSSLGERRRDGGWGAGRGLVRLPFLSDCHGDVSLLSSITLISRLLFYNLPTPQTLRLDLRICASPGDSIYTVVVRSSALKSAFVRGRRAS